MVKVNYRNSEGYRDPTAYHAINNVMKNAKKKKKDTHKKPRSKTFVAKNY